ncbi:MAG TPA: hypothetical protein VIH31_00410 [Candidatus Paceibacterota bacterium]
MEAVIIIYIIIGLMIAITSDENEKENKYNSVYILNFKESRKLGIKLFFMWPLELIFGTFTRKYDTAFKNRLKDPKKCWEYYSDIPIK